MGFSVTYSKSSQLRTNPLSRTPRNTTTVNKNNPASDSKNFELKDQDSSTYAMAFNKKNINLMPTTLEEIKEINLKEDIQGLMMCKIEKIHKSSIIFL